jgi:hypothetical protein
MIKKNTLALSNKDTVKQAREYGVAHGVFMVQVSLHHKIDSGKICKQVSTDMKRHVHNQLQAHERFTICTCQFTFSPAKSSLIISLIANALLTSYFGRYFPYLCPMLLALWEPLASSPAACRRLARLVWSRPLRWWHHECVFALHTCCDCGYVHAQQQQLDDRYEPQLAYFIRYFYCCSSAFSAVF